MGSGQPTDGLSAPGRLALTHLTGQHLHRVRRRVPARELVGALQSRGHAMREVHAADESAASCGFIPAAVTNSGQLQSPPPDVAIEHLFPLYSPEKNADLKAWFE